MERRAPLHHTFLDGDFLRFERMSREVTAAQAVLDPRTAAQEIDRVLQIALNTSKPVYLGVPLDVANAPILAHPLRNPLRCMGSEPAAVEEFRKALELRFSGETGITMLAGPRIHRRGLETLVAELAGLPGFGLPPSRIEGAAGRGPPGQPGHLSRRHHPLGRGP